MTDSRERARAWDLALRSSAAIQTLDRNMPGLVERLRGVVERFERKHGRSLRLVAVDIGEPYWGDIGQHPRMYDFLAALLVPGPDGRIARAIAGIEGIPADAGGNLIVGESHVSPSVEVRGSVLIDARMTGRGVVRNSVLIGTMVRADILMDSGWLNASPGYSL